jgi:adenylate kinase
MGGQGCGKGTQAAAILDCRKCNYIETGAMFRSLPADSDIAKLIAGGNLVPDEKLFELVAQNITDDADNLIDGFPRTLPQAEWLAKNYADKFDIRVIYFNIPESVMLERIQKRLNQGGGRADDADMTAVRKRLDSFWTKTMPAIEYLQNCDAVKFYDIDAMPAAEEITAKVLEVI